MARILTGPTQSDSRRRRCDRRQGLRRRAPLWRSIYGLDCVRHEAGTNPEAEQKCITSREQLLRSLLNDRILILDGAMGTMIQRYTLTEADFRGPRFANHRRDLKGD